MSRASEFSTSKCWECSCEYSSPEKRTGRIFTRSRACPSENPSERQYSPHLISCGVSGSQRYIRSISPCSFPMVCCDWRCTSNNRRLWSACMVCIWVCRMSMVSLWAATFCRNAPICCSCLLTFDVPTSEPIPSTMLEPTSAAALFSFSVFSSPFTAFNSCSVAFNSAVLCSRMAFACS